MNSLTELYNNALVPLDAELEKQASAELAQLAAEEEEMIKQAEEEDAAGRIMARGFQDELQKLAAGMPPFIQQQMDKKKEEGDDEDEEDKDKKKKEMMAGTEKKAQRVMSAGQPTGTTIKRQPMKTNQATIKTPKGYTMPAPKGPPAPKLSTRQLRIPGTKTAIPPRKVRIAGQ